MSTPSRDRRSQVCCSLREVRAIPLAWNSYNFTKLTQGDRVAGWGPERRMTRPEEVQGAVSSETMISGVFFPVDALRILSNVRWAWLLSLAPLPYSMVRLSAFPLAPPRLWLFLWLCSTVWGLDCDALVLCFAQDCFNSLESLSKSHSRDICTFTFIVAYSQKLSVKLS